MDFLTLLNMAIQILTALVFFPAFLNVLVAFAEYFGMDPAKSDAFIFWANVAAFVGIFVAVLMGKVDVVSQIDQFLGGLTKLLADILVVLTGGFIALKNSLHDAQRFRSTSFMQRRFKVLAKAK